MNNKLDDFFDQNSDELDWDKYIDSLNKPIHYLAYSRKNALIQQVKPSIFLEQVLEPNKEGDTIAHIAAKTNNTDLFDYIIDTNIDAIYVKNKLGATPLFYLLHDVDFIKNIINNNKIFNHNICNNCTLLEYYIKLDNAPIFFNLLKKMILDPSNSDNNKILFTTIDSQLDTQTKIKILNALINQGIDPNLLNDKFLSPLIIAVTGGQYEITKFLIKKGANVNYFGPKFRKSINNCNS